jgi:hypothetical protein
VEGEYPALEGGEFYMKNIAKHADKRLRERAGTPRKATRKMADTALEKGISRKECT